ncbi:murein hydrolase activator EnvC family protein [Oceanicoccus sagamiensis]|uniref:ATPase n=1 Tax=Oceanicoccus sagamiensis TaxID=716816 RepID=A0A1X9N937_9GAMM|nr:peptidoglycan DD-metalloendopeptidase family protein [Oceanicoccus sagamiensis]ARN73604.1 ATPase [Oceanicoccus sagamiensis]
MGERFTLGKKTVSLGFFLAIALALLPLHGAANNDETKTRQQIQQLNKEMAALRKLLSEFKGQRSDVQNSLQKSEVDIGSVQKKIRGIQQQLSQEQAELESLQVKRKALNTARRDQQKFIEQQVLAAYQVGQQKKIKVLLNQEQPDKISRALTYYDYFNQARSEQIENYINIISELNTIEPRIVEKTQTLSNAKAKLGKAHQSLLASKKARQKNLAKINSAIKNNDQRLKQASKNRSELERILAAVEQTLANISIPSDYSPFGKLKGKLPWPVSGKPSNRFGYKRNGTALRWQGLAIPATEGSKVEAIHSGRVVFADWLRGSGLLVIIDHGDGYMSLYAHNQSLLKETGDWVNPGDMIATVGNSGGQQRAGLYFEIRHNGKPTDPRRWCKRA